LSSKGLAAESLKKIGGINTSIEFYGEDTAIARRLSSVGRVKFLTSIYVFTSDRRFKNEGFVHTGIVYYKNFLSVAFRGKPSTQEYKDFR